MDPTKSSKDAGRSRCRVATSSFTRKRLRIALVGADQGRYQALLDVAVHSDLPWKIERVPAGTGSLHCLVPGPDLVLVASDAEDISPRDWVVRVKLDVPDVPVLIYGPARDLGSLFLLLGTGAAGWLDEPPVPGELEGTVCEALAGGYPLSSEARRRLMKGLQGRDWVADGALFLSRQQRSIVMCFLDGKSPKEIPAELHIQYSTFHTHLARLMKRLDVHHWSAVAAKYLTVGALPATKRDTE